MHPLDTAVIDAEVAFVDQPFLVPLILSSGAITTLPASAWARRHEMLLSLQDLTNPGLSMIRAALFAAHVRTVNDIELNSPQFTPAANKQWLPRLAGLFEPRGGCHQLPKDIPLGLGSKL